MNKILWMSVCVSMFMSNIQAQTTDDDLVNDLQLNTITTAVPFLLIAPDSRSAGMGDVGVASSPDGNSGHWNPAKLAFLEKNMGASISYTPWLRQLVPDINLAYVSGYKKIDKEQGFAASLLYFSLGEITFTDNNAQVIGQFKPSEFAVSLSYGRKLGDRFSGGLGAKFINSNLTGGIDVEGGSTKAGTSFAVDLGAFYTNDDAEVFGQEAIFNVGLSLSNIGAKMSYTDNAEKDFIPMNMRLGQSLNFILDDYNSIAILTDVNKLLVPTPPIYATDANGQPIIDEATEEPVIAKGKDPNVSVAQGLFQSFGDAPGGFEEELREFNISAGLEYWYNKQFAVRTGYFHEHATKGNRKYFTVGAGLKYSVFGIDFAYLIATTQQNPLANTIRFTLSFDLDDFKSQNEE